MSAETGNWRLKPAADIRVDVVIPAYNEAHVLEHSIRRVHEFFEAQVPYRWRIVIAENGSRDGTADVGRDLSQTMPRVDMVTVGQPGRGLALRTAWTQSSADVVSYTDVDLSTELEAFPRLFTALIDGGHDVAVGSRLLPDSKTTRGLKRTIISRGYNLILKIAFGVSFSDAQTGFKGLTRRAVREVLPLARDNAWFLNTEILVLAEQLGLRIADLPVTWVDDDDSRVKILSTAWKDLRGVHRLRRTFRDRAGWTAMLQSRDGGGTA